MQHLTRMERVEIPVRRRTPQSLKPFDFKPEVTLSHDKENQLTILEVVCPDRPGVLSIIANIFVDMDIHLHSAKISTLGERVEDVFYITSNASELIANEETLIDKLCSELDDHVTQRNAK